MEHGGGGHSQRQASKLASIDVCRCKQSVSRVKRDPMVVLLEVLDSGKPARKHRRRSDCARVEVIEDGQAIKSRVPGQDQAYQGECSKTGDVDRWFQDSESSGGVCHLVSCLPPG
jgi:hypothetical protein